MKNEDGDFNYVRYAEAIEDALARLTVKNGMVRVKQIQLETSVPEDLILEVLDRELVEFPDRIDRIVERKGGKKWER